MKKLTFKIQEKSGMKNNILFAVLGLLLLCGIFACSEENRYETSVVNSIQMYLDNEAYQLNTGSSNKPLFIYDAEGNYVANYSDRKSVV